MIWRYTPDSNIYQSIDFLEYTSVTRAAMHQESIEGFTEKIHTVFTVEGYEDMPVSDFPSMGGLLPMFSERALDVLWPLIRDNVITSKLRWLYHPDRQIYAVWVSKVIDCVDRKQSEVKYFSDGGIMNIPNPVFFEERLEGEHMFRIPDLNASPIYLSDKFRRTVIENELIGLKFKRKHVL